MGMKRTTVAVVLAAGFALSVTSQAALIDRGGGLIYDDVLNITWLSDANYAATELTPARIAAIATAVNAASPAWLGGRTLGPSDFYGDGGMTWWGAMAWADQLVFADYSDWRLPRMSPGDSPYGASNNGSNNGSQAYLYGATGTGYGTATPSGGWGLPTDADGIWSEMGWMYYHNMGNLSPCIMHSQRCRSDGLRPSALPGWPSGRPVQL